MLKKWSLSALIIIAGFMFGVGIISAQEGSVVHKVVEGETLWDLAGRYMQNSFSWPLIWEANKQAVADPHWIYPGQELIIPPQTTSEQVAAPEAAVQVQPEAPAEAAPVEEALPEAAPVEEVYVEPEPIEEKPVVSPKVTSKISAVKKPIPVVSEYMAFEAGFIGESDDKPSGHIIGSDRKDIEGLMYNDPVYINLGSRDGVKPGDKYALYRKGKSVKHPQNKKNLGNMITIVGVLQVKDIEEKTSRAILVKTFEPISRKEAFRPYEQIIVPKDVSPLPVEKSNEGCIVAIKQVEHAATAYKVVYIDKGLANGIMPGDVFEIYRTGTKASDPDRGGKNQLPELVIGRLQVLLVRNNTAAAFICKSSVEDIKVGEKIRLIKQVPTR
jgi:LysM repeat protein